MAKKEKIFKVNIAFNGSVEKVAQTHSNQVLPVSKENIQDDTIDGLLKAFKNKAPQNMRGIEFWYDRDLQKLLGCNKWEFKNVIDKAKTSCKQF